MQNDQKDINLDDIREKHKADIVYTESGSAYKRVLELGNEEAIAMAIKDLLKRDELDD